MTLFDELVVEQRQVRRGDLCTVSRLKAVLTPEQWADLEKALYTASGGVYVINGTTIARYLNAKFGDRAFGVKGSTIQRHRNGGCSCGPEVRGE